MSIRLLLTSILLCLIGELYAQSYFNVFQLNSSYSLNNQYNYKKANLDIVNHGGALQVPFQLDSNNLVLIGVSGNKTIFLYNEDNLTNLTTKVSALNVQIGWQKQITPNKQRLIMVIPAIKSDFLDISKKDYQLAAAILYTKKINTNLKLKYGLYVNQHNFGPFLAPLLGLDYKMNNNWRLFGTLPSYLTLEKKYSNTFRAGVDLRINTTTYRFSEKFGNPYMQQNLNTLALFVEAYPQKILALRLSAGHTVFRSFRAYAENQKLDLNILGVGIGEKRNELATSDFGDIKDGLVFELSLFIRVEID